MRRLGGAAAARIAAGLTLLAAGGCATSPVTVSQTFIDPKAVAPSTATPAKPAAAAAAGPRCAVNIGDLRDTRTSPEILGVIGGRALKTPADRETWLRSMAEGLGARGFAVTYDKGAAAGPDQVGAELTLSTAWATDIRANKAANVVLHLKASRAGGGALDRDYRGALSNINWASGEHEMQALVDKAIALALDDMAKDLHRICPA